MPGPRFKVGGGGSQVKVKVGRERFLKSRAAVDSDPREDIWGRSSREQAGLAVVSVSGARVQGLEEAAGRRVSRLGG